MSEFNQKGHFNLIGKTLRLNVANIEYFILLKDVFLVLAGEPEGKIYLHNIAKPDLETEKH
jgi:hypothetical protein